MSFFKKRIKGFPRYIVTEAVIHPYDKPHDKGIDIINWNAIPFLTNSGNKIPSYSPISLR
jgi:hypothetical protein